MAILYSEEIMFHISDLKKFNRCPRIFLLDQITEPTPFRRMVRLDDEVTALAAEYLGAKDCFVGERGDDPAESMRALQEHEWILKARFEYGGLRIKVPFLHHVEGGYDLYFLFVGLFPRADDMQFYCDTVWVLEHLQIPLKEIRIIHLNASYVREDELDLSRLFVTSSHFYNSKNHLSTSVRDAIYANMKDLSRQIAKMETAMSEPLPEAVRTRRCAGRQKCRHYERCFAQESELPCNSILTLTGTSERYAMSQEGIQRLKDADPARIEGTPMQYAQIMADRCGGLYADRNALKNWFRDVTFPVSFIDFEWECFAIPPYRGMKPYDVLVFEYSLHTLQEDGTVDHKVFLSVHDDRRKFVEEMLKDVPETGTVFAYNADGAEKIRIRELAELFPEYRDQLLSINERMKDLQVPFVCGYVYDTRMKGVWTLKRIMSMMDEPGYHELDIQQGMDAVFQWRLLDREDKNADFEQIVDELKAYCGMDSYATLVVFNWLRQLCDEQA